MRYVFILLGSALFLTSCSDSAPTDSDSGSLSITAAVAQPQTTGAGKVVVAGGSLSISGTGTLVDTLIPVVNGRITAAFDGLSTGQKALVLALTESSGDTAWFGRTTVTVVEDQVSQAEIVLGEYGSSIPVIMIHALLAEGPVATLFSFTWSVEDRHDDFAALEVQGFNSTFESNWIPAATFPDTIQFTPDAVRIDTIGL